jgi:hypothetical protein
MSPSFQMVRKNLSFRVWKVLQVIVTRNRFTYCNTRFKDYALNLVKGAADVYYMNENMVGLKIGFDKQ